MKLGRRPRSHAPSQTGPEISIDWRTLMDGRPHRVRRGHDFSCTVNEFNQAARQAAELAGKRLLATRDRAMPRRYAWVQFADREIQAGEPCRCGFGQLERIGVTLVRCQSCRAVLVLARLPDEDEITPKRRRTNLAAAVDGARSTLDDFFDVRLECFSNAPDERCYVGFGRNKDGQLMLLVVRLPIVEGNPLPDELSSLEAVHEVVFAKPVAPAESQDDPLELEAGWEIVL